MRNKIFRYALGVCLLGMVPAASVVAANPVAEVAGNPVKHTVSKGETLYAISRKYQVTVAQIQDWNNLSGTAIREGQVLVVSAPEAKSIEAPAAKAVDAPQTGAALVHEVKAGETLYRIAGKYNMTPNEVVEMNQLASTTIRIGQKLKVVQKEHVEPPADILYMAADPQPSAEEQQPTAEVQQEEPVKEEPEVVPNPEQGVGLMEMIAETTGVEPVREPSPEIKVLSADIDPHAGLPNGARVIDYVDEHTGKSFHRVEERGTAGLIDDFSTDQAKFFAFHKYLPAGSYIRVDYPERSQSILVEVISKLPMEDDHTIRMTSKCMDYLRMNEPGAPVVLRYVVPAGN